MSVRLAYPSPPAVGPAYLKGLVDRRPRRLIDGMDVPVIEAAADAAVADLAALSRYREVCVLPEDGLLPVAYPHVLTGGLHMAMLLHRAFPVRLPGLVHLANVIEIFEPIPETATLAFSCRLEEGRITHRGAEFTLVTNAAHAGKTAWRETMTFLAPGPRRGRPQREGSAELPPQVAEFDVPADTGRRYARVSGDYNPIHLAAILARPFGFRAAIAHGMWSLARCQGLLGGAPGRGAVLDVRFLKPLFLPARAQLYADAPGGAGQQEFWLTAGGNKRPCLKGTWKPGAAPGPR
ncbi:MAG: MaoC/PaaZ C-terminal domain-containing protein [Gammaproteobacteria bacterium]